MNQPLLKPSQTVEGNRPVFFPGMKNRTEPNQTFFPYSPVVQPKLKIGQPGDKFERQADQVADSVIKKPGSEIQRQPVEEEEILQTKNKPGIQRKCAECEHEENIQTKPNNNPSPNRYASEKTSHQLIMSSGTGSRLPNPVQAEMKQKIGADFGNVSIHTGSRAIQLSRSLGARAFTHGSDIYFNSGEYNPKSSDGKHLLAHELTHVLQQNIHTSEANTIQKEDEPGPSPDPEPEEDENEFEFNFEVLPPALKFTIGNWMLETNTGSAELQFTRNLFEYSLGYSFGSEIFAGIEGPGMSSRFGVNPGSGAMSLGFTRDQFRFGGSFNTADTSVGLNVGYGASLLPMPLALQESVYGAWGGITSIYGDLGSMQDPISFYQSHSDDVDAVMGAVRALQPLAGEDSTRFGAGLRFTYNPQTGALISGGMQWFF